MHKLLRSFDRGLACGFNWGSAGISSLKRLDVWDYMQEICLGLLADWMGDAFVAIAGKLLSHCITYGKNKGWFQSSSWDVREFIFIFLEVISIWWDTASPGTSKAPSSSLSRCSFSFQRVWFNFNAHFGSLSWICMDQLNPGRESYTIDKKMALLMHGAGPAYLTEERFI